MGNHLIENQGLFRKKIFFANFLLSECFCFFIYLKPKKLKRGNKIKARGIFIMTLDQNETSFP